MDKRNKKIYLEILRIIAIFCVVFNHTNGYGFYYFTKTENMFWYNISLFCSVLCKIAVPLFFMISGYLLLGKRESIKVILSKRVLRYGVIIAISTLFTQVVIGICLGERVSIREIIKMIYRGTDVGTYWYLYAYLGILLMLPCLRCCTEILTKEFVCYLLIMRMILVGILPILIFVGLGYSMGTKFDSPILEQSVFYCLIGYYIGNSEDYFSNRKNQIVGRGLSLLCILLSAHMTSYEYLISGNYSEQFLQGLLPIVCITVFGMIRHYAMYITPEGWIEKSIEFVGDKTFGVYLLEPAMRIILQDFQLFLRAVLPEFVASLVWCIIFVFIGVGVTSILKMIPVIKKIL